MILQYQKNGNLTKGIHEIEWEHFEKEYGYTDHRKELLKGLLIVAKALKKNNCQVIFIDGSFVTKETQPKDFDACFFEAGMTEANFKALIAEFPEFIDNTPKRIHQKRRFKGEIFPSTSIARHSPFAIYIQFFQFDRDDNPKGIIKINLNSIP